MFCVAVAVVVVPRRNNGNIKDHNLDEQCHFHITIV